MRIRGIVAGALLVWGLACGAAVTPASATMLISEDRGGQIGHYLQAFAALRSSGEDVVIDGNCLSACTLVLGLIPHERICATPRARLGFHAAWMPDENGHAVTSPMGTEALWNIYPSNVRRWINHHGGLSRRMIFMQGHELTQVVSACGTQTVTKTHGKTHVAQSHSTTRSHRRVLAARMVRYGSANNSANTR